jgi:molecular chaperone HtpG
MQKKIDVLILTDPIDDFWIPLMPEYSGKKFVSISRGNVNLDEIKIDEKKKKKKKEKDSDYEALLKEIKSCLNEKVSNVIISKSLTESPARLIADENGMDIQMEKMMMMQNPDFEGSPRVLEINIEHALIKSMNKKLESSNDVISDMALLLFDQSKILEGKVPENLQEFNKRLTKVMQLAI